MFQINFMNRKLSKLKSFFIALLVIASSYFVINTITIWSPINEDVRMVLGLFIFAIYASSVVLLILIIVECVSINKLSPGYGLKIQCIFVSIFIGAIALFFLLGLIRVASETNSGDIAKAAIHSTRTKVTAWVMVSLIISGVIAFYAISLTKIMRLIKRNEKLAEQIKNNTQDENSEEQK
ncbi:hypothetical protein [Mycoplasma todarodis]|uniref:Uncharacterized protein n=1 Tax=Mycoplasma todarodis TaxID=1937191 RepID=A0A4R0XW82_9MOLU|nr:hypothetical protein [Mycoplasma todarodis]TCG12077.1 hypothetical protein C4B25_00080 [Mycoplasma todarodis]